MDAQESSSFTVLKKLEIQTMIKQTACNLIVKINRKSEKKTIDTEFKRFSEIKYLIDHFRALRRAYKSIEPPNFADTMEKRFNGMMDHISDIKDMLIDQNEWYEEMFYNEEDTNLDKKSDVTTVLVSKKTFSN